MSGVLGRNFSGFLKRFSYSIAHYDLNLILNPRRRLIQADTAITLIPQQNARNLSFLLADSCNLEHITYLGIALPYKISPGGTDLNLLSVTLPIQPEAGERIVVNLVYSFTVADWGESLDLPPSANWYPFSPAPQKYTCTLNVVADESARILGPGEFRGSKPAGTRVSSQWSAAAPFRGIHLVAGYFLKNNRATTPPLEVNYPRRLLNQAKAVGNYCEEILPFLVETLGPAPFSALTVVLTDEPQPRDSSSLYISYLSIGALEQGQEDSTGKEKYVHQYKFLTRNLAQHWLEDNLAAPEPRDRWYLEGLAEYVSWLAVEAKYGKVRREKYMAAAREEALAAPNLPLCEAEVPLPPWALAKAGWLFRICHGLAGEEFLLELHNLTGAGDIAPGAADFCQSFAGQGDDFPRFYKGWCQTRNQVKIEATELSSHQAESGEWQLRFKLANSGRLQWPYPVEIELSFAKGPGQRLRLNCQKEPHLLSIPGPLRSLTLDPEFTLLNWSGNMYIPS